MPVPRASRRWRRAFVALIALAIAWFASGILAGWALSRRWSGLEVERAPSSGEFVVQTLELGTSDGRSVRAWLFAPDAPGASVVMLHGWRGSRSTVAHRAAALARSGHAVLAPSLRAHGDSAGSHYDFGREAWRDIAACVDALAQRRPGKPVVLVGFSYGAAVAAETAVREGARIDGLVLDSGFASLRGAVRNRCDLFLPPVLEDLAASALFAAAPLVFPELDEISPERCVASIGARIPVRILRGELDERASAAEADALAQAAGPLGALVVFAGAEHDRCFETDPERWVATVGPFASELARPR